MRATTRAASVDRFMRTPAKKRPNSIPPIVQTLWSLDLGLRIFQRVARISRFWRRCGKATLERTGPGVLSANDVVASDQAGRRRRRPCTHEESPGGAAQAAPAEAALAALGLYPQHAAALRGASGRRLALLG